MIRITRNIMVALLVLTALPVMGQRDIGKKSKFKQEARTYSPPRNKEDHQEIFDHIDKANATVQSDPQAALKHLELALGLSYKLKNQRGEGYAYHTLGAVNYHIEKYEQSIRYYEKALAIFKTIKEQAAIPTAWRNAGMACEAAGKPREALAYYSSFLAHAKKNGTADEIWDTQETMARIYEELGEYQNALAIRNRQLKTAQAANDEDEVFDTYSSIARLHLLMGDTTRALDNFDLSQKIATGNSNPLNEAKYYSNISDYYEQQQNPTQQLAFEKKALEKNIDAGNTEGAAFNQLKVADILIEQDSAAKAIPYLVNSIALTDETSTIEEKGQVYEKLATAYEKMGNYQEALDNYKLYLNIADSLTNERAKEAMEALKMERVILQRETEIRRLVEQRDSSSALIVSLEQAQRLKEEGLKRQRLINYTLFGSLLLVIFSSVLIWRSSRQKRRANQLLALRSLRSQMNPHFIFNSLNSVNSFIAKNDERSANKYLSEFSRLMRSVMENSKFDFVSLQSEVEILKLYLSLEHFRFQDKFDYVFNIDQGIDLDGVQIPPMLVQPYIENAVWHGLRYKDGKGKLEVDISKNGSTLKIRIEDDGIGRKKSKELKTVNQMKQESTGMKNIQSRIDIINDVHGAKYDVAITDLEADGKDAGTRVVIEIPILNKD